MYMLVDKEVMSLHLILHIQEEDSTEEEMQDIEVEVAGGATDIRIGGNTLYDRVIVAGGGRRCLFL